MSEVFNVSANPHVRSKDTTQTIMRDVLIALTPASIFGIYNFGLGALIRIIVGIAACVASEALYEYFMHKKITVSDLSAAVTGLLIALNIPSTLNVGYEIVGCVFAIIIAPRIVIAHVNPRPMPNPSNADGIAGFFEAYASARPRIIQFTTIRGI